MQKLFLVQTVFIAVVGQHRQLQLHPRQRRAQIVGNAGQHLRSFADLTLNALFHLDKGNAGAAHFRRTVRLELFIVHPFAELFGRFRQIGDRTNLNAQEQNRHQKQQQRSADHPGNEPENGSAENVL